MSYRENDTEFAYVLRRVIKKDLIDGKPRSAMPEYKIWAGILARCTNPALKSYPRYGGRGITICERWSEDFANFYRDMGTRPSGKHSIDRIDNDGNYEPGNCRLATPDVQAANKASADRSNDWYWSDADVETLKQMFAKHYSEAEIGSVIGRGAAAVRLRAFKLGLSRDGSITRLKKKHPELLHILREQGGDAFVAAIAIKMKARGETKAAAVSKVAADRARNVAGILASGDSRSAKMKALRGSGMNLSDIGRLFAISRERVRQIEALGWPDFSDAPPVGADRKINQTNPAVRAKKINRLCRAWNAASREARLMFLQAAPSFVATTISEPDVAASAEASQ